MNILSKYNVTSETNCIDSVGAHKHYSEWTLDTLQLSSGVLAYQSNYYISNNIQLIEVYETEGRARVKARGPKDKVIFYIPKDENLTSHTNKHDLNPGKIYSVAPGIPFELASTAQTEFYILCIQKDLIQYNLKRGLQLCSCHNFISLNEENIKLLTHTIKHLDWGLVGHKKVGYISKLSEFQVISLLTKIFSDASFTPFNIDLESDNLKKTMLVEQMIFHSNNSVSTSELAHKANINERTLRKYFKDHFGFSVKCYNKIVLLNKMRQAIRNNPNHKIIDYASSLGITETGRFSVEYNKLFKETPSETKKKFDQPKYL